MQTIKVWFTDFWPLFKQKDNFLIDILKERYNVVLDSHNPDFLFYSLFGIENKKYNCVKIFFTGENERPDFTECDYALSFDYSDNPRNYRFPLYSIYDDVNKLTKPKPDFEEIFTQKTKFCNFIYSNPANPVRNNFFKKLSKYKKVDSYGKLYRNAEFYSDNKLDILNDYKFTIAFENDSYPGYTTEKIFEPMLKYSMPIYWGNPLIGKEFNAKSFINYFDFDDEDSVIDFIIQVDNDIDKYYEIYKQPYFVNNNINKYSDLNNLYQYLDKVFNTDIIPISDSTPAASNSDLDKRLWMIENKISFFEKSMKLKIKNFSFLKLKIRTKQKLGHYK